MLKPLPLSKARLVVELGSGTGVFTRALLKQMRADATLLAFEINPRFARYISSVVSDRRLVLVNASAETVRHEVRRLGLDRIDAVVSSLGLAFIPDEQRHACLGALTQMLDADGVFTQYHYLHGLQFQNGRLARSNVTDLLHHYFRSVHRGIVWRNLPPAYVLVCRGPLKTPIL
jgi:phospholipid N-methyltransferase